MGSDPALFFSNRFILYYEWQYINNLKREKVISAHKFYHTFRFTNDLITINNEVFEKNVRIIYSAELKLKKENQINGNANF